MSDSDLQTTITTRMNGTLQPLELATTKVNALGGAYVKLNQHSEDYQSKAGKPFQEAHKHAHTFGKTVSELGHALSRLKGPIGEVAHQALGGAGLNGSLGRVAVTCGLAAIAFEAFNRVFEHRAEMLKKQIELEEKYRGAVEAAEASERSHAKAGIGHDEALRGTVRAGGQAADTAAHYIAGSYGVDLDEARRGVSASFNRKFRTADERSTALVAAGEYARAGGSFEEGVQKIIQGPGYMARVRKAAQSGKEEDTLDVAARMLQETVTGKPQGASVERLRQAQEDVANDPTLRAARGVRGIDNQRQHAEETRAGEGVAEGAARAELAEAINPLAVEIGKLTRNKQIDTDNLQRLADSQPLVIAWLKNLGMILGGEGSFQQQVNRGNMVQF
jgi:hypothetical protein